MSNKHNLQPGDKFKVEYEVFAVTSEGITIKRVTGSDTCLFTAGPGLTGAAVDIVRAPRVPAVGQTWASRISKSHEYTILFLDEKGAYVDWVDKLNNQGGRMHLSPTSDIFNNKMDYLRG